MALTERRLGVVVVPLDYANLIHPTVDRPSQGVQGREEERSNCNNLGSGEHDYARCLPQRRRGWVELSIG